MAAKVKKVRFLFADGTSGLFKVLFNLEQCIIAQTVENPRVVIISKDFISAKV